MKYNFVPPLMPSLSRYSAIKKRTPNASILRSMEYEALEKIEIQGRILDFGGGHGASYVPILPKQAKLVSVNIDAQYKPDEIVPVGGELPFDDNSFDGAICLNVLEHIYDTRFVLDEMFRVLKPGATLYISVPFIFRVHGHPDDYSRHTSSWWRETMQRVGFASMEIQPLVWGKASSGQMIRGNGAWPWLTTWLNILRDIAMARVRCKTGEKLSGGFADSVPAVASGWQIAVSKPEQDE